MNSDVDVTGLPNGSRGGTMTFSSDPARVTLHIIADPHEICPLLDLYQPVIDWVDPNLKLFRVTERQNAVHNASSGNHQNKNPCAEIPAIAVMVFLRGPDPDGDQNGGSKDRIQEARRLFTRPPWRFHHNERLNQGKINTVPTNSQEYFYTSSDLPLWAIRHVHYGTEHVRYVLYATDSSWPDQVHFYRLILGLEPDLLRDDFCLFTVYKHERYDVQFALKKLDSKARIATLESVHIQVKVKDVGQLVPLFPNVCRPISDVKWQTTDHDGNVVVLDVIKSLNSNIEDNRLQKQPTYKRSDLSINTSHHLISQQSSDQLILNGTKYNDNSPTLHIPRSGTPFYQIGQTHFLFNQHLGTSTALSDSDDLDIDLPSPPIRMTSWQEEDEESLTLTNTSEESGIQMQHGSEDLSFCDEEPLRPILTKNSSLKIRHVKLKVRFKEKDEIFEDDSYSRLSSGIESEDQSDSEMETRFPYNPPDKTNVISGHSDGSSGVTRTADNTTKPSVNSDKSDYQNDINTSRFHNSLHISHELPAGHDTRAGPESECGRSKQEDFSNERSITPTASSACDQNQNYHSTYNNKDSNTNPVTNTVNQDANRGVQSRPGPSTCDDDKIRQGRPPLPPYPGHRHKSPPSYHSVCSKPQTNSPEQRQSRPQSLDNNQRQLSNENVIISSQLSKTHAQIPHTHSNPSDNSSPRAQNCDQVRSRPPTHVNIQRKSPGPPQPPARDSKTKLRSEESHTPPNPKSQVQITKSDFPLNCTARQNGYKTFWFEETNSDPSKTKGKLSGSHEEDTTLKFTLKFDTCPTSGLSCRQEQIGFYV